MANKEQFTVYLLFTVLVGAFGGFLFGFHTGVISGALMFLTTSFQLSIADQGMVVSIILLGGLAGALLAGPIADRVGRRPTIGLSASMFVFGTLFIVLSNSYEMILLGRFINGIGIGVISLSGPLFLAEISPPRHRGSFVSLFQLAIAIGILFSFATDYYFASSSNWRWMFGVGIFPALFLMLALFFLPETPPWLLKSGLEERAIKTLMRLRKDTLWKSQIEAMKSSASTHKHGGWKVLLTPRLRTILIIGLILSACQQVTGINTVIYYAPTIFEAAGYQSANSAIVATLLIGTVNTLMTLVSFWLLAKFGRRILLLVGMFGMGISLIFLSAAFLIKTQLIAGISLFSIMAYVSFFAFSLGPITWVILSEIFPLKVRSLAMSIAIGVNWISNYLVSLTFLHLINFMGTAGTFFFYALICGVSFWFVYRFIPETKDKTLEEIEADLLK